ncbi:pilus assembly protein [Georgenia yuyongxinii]|uniref:Pilus assembly protein n=2 Tax=Georgenia yuyongxinii TaxID=2589797 RepID=A0A5B8C7U6_9MICO|nr:pilus assembly protein [Georgenia yuyongxinii]
MLVPTQLTRPSPLVTTTPRNFASQEGKKATHRKPWLFRSQRGASAVEFALVSPVLIVLVLGIIDFGLYINAASVVGNAAREGVRVASLGATSTEITTVVKNAMSDLPGAALPATSIAELCLTPAGAQCASYADAAAGGTAIVEISYVHTWLTPLGLGNDATIVKSSEMRIE